MDAIKRFLTKIEKQPNGCWHYVGAKDADGYGMFWHNSRTIGAHRFSAEYLGNLTIKGQCVCHACDNPICVNPQHLFIGSNQQNTQDRHIKGRSVKGSKVGTSVYNETIIKSIKDAYKSRPHYRGIFKDLSEEFNVSYSVVWYACRNKSWLHT
jgi:hypothetical protein